MSSASLSLESSEMSATSSSESDHASSFSDMLFSLRFRTFPGVLGYLAWAITGSESIDYSVMGGILRYIVLNPSRLCSFWNFFVSFLLTMGPFF